MTHSEWNGGNGLGASELRRRRDVMTLQEALLRRRGYLTVRAKEGHNGGPHPDVVAVSERYGYLLLLVESESTVDRDSTRRRLVACVRRGPTLVCVPWQLEPRMRSNLERWGIRNAEVQTY